jgi:hypothetical protein
MSFARCSATSRRLFVLSLLMIFNGCARSVAPSVESNGFQLSRNCERLAANVEDPQDAGRLTLNTDPKLAVAEYKVALGEANDNIDATRECQANQRKRVAKGS